VIAPEYTAGFASRAIRLRGDWLKASGQLGRHFKQKEKCCQRMAAGHPRQLIGYSNENAPELFISIMLSMAVGSQIARRQMGRMVGRSMHQLCLDAR
jgi:hypothetical protein